MVESTPGATCPAGHTSAVADHCDVCGLPLDPAAAPLPGAGPAATRNAPTSSTVLGVADAPGSALACPHCGAPNPPDAADCQICGRDLAAGGTPPPNAAWVVERWVDPAWYQVQESPDPLPAPGPPVVLPLRGSDLVVGRTSPTRDTRPDVDCPGDSGVSRRQSRLTTDGRRWWVEDLGSANGTFVGTGDGPLPTEPLPDGERRELGPGDRVYVGAWSRLVVRPATDDERATLD